MADLDERARASLERDFGAPALRTAGVRLSADNFRPDELLDAVLGGGERAFGSFSRVGHLLHLNLKEYHEEQKEVGKLLAKEILN